jgi:GAF domain-containing protein
MRASFPCLPQEMMTDHTLIQPLQSIFTAEDPPDVVLSALIPKLGEVLDCDRCFLYLRNPYNKLGKVTHCWRRGPQYPSIGDPDWKQEPDSLPQADPLFAAALQAKPTIFVEDVETASPEVVNLAFEQSNFGHRALIHSHLVQDGLLWGVLQPCLFNQPRIWTEFDRSVIAQVEQAITPLAIDLVKASGKWGTSNRSPVKAE